MKRRVIKLGDRRYQVEFTTGEVSEFSYCEKPRKWSQEINSCIDFRPEDEQWTLRWDGVFTDSFICEEDILLFLIKFGYGILDQNLIPSEILADFNLGYLGGKWVDEWCCQEDLDVVFKHFEPMVRPKNRKIVFSGRPRITPKKKRFGHRRGFSPHDVHLDQTDFGEIIRIPPEIKIPELNFADLERPRIRRRRIPRDWADLSECAYGGWSRYQKPEAPDHPDEECVFILKIGKDAEKAYETQKKGIAALLK